MSYGPTEEIGMSGAELRRLRRGRMVDRLAELTSEEFIRATVAAHVPELSGVRQPVVSYEVLRPKATGRLTIRYVLSKGVIVYGKFYDDELGPRAFGGLSALRQAGLGAASSYQAAEPLHFDKALNLLLLRQAEGVPLSQTLDHAPLEEALRHAQLGASWLAKFHRTALPGIKTEPPCDRVRLFKLGASLTKAAAANPHESDLLLNLLQRLRELAPSADAPAPFALVHGQYTPGNVFVAETRTTVIDLDRLCYSDPAKDVAMFLFRVRHRGARDGTFERACAIASSFQAHYRDQAAGNLVNFGFYRALQSLRALAEFLKVPQTAGETYEQEKQFCLREFEESSLNVPVVTASGVGMSGAESAGW